MDKVLVIEDEPMLATLLSRMLAKCGLVADVAATGAEGCRLAADPAYVLILSDLTLPGAPQGLPLIEALRAARPDCPLVVSSGYASEDLILELKARGVEHLLSKPFDVPSAMALLRRLAGQPAA